MEQKKQMIWLKILDLVYSKEKMTTKEICNKIKINQYGRWNNLKPSYTNQLCKWMCSKGWFKKELELVKLEGTYATPKRYTWSINPKYKNFLKGLIERRMKELENVSQS